MRGRSVSASAAKPLVANQALYDARRRMNSAVRAGVWRKLGLFFAVAQAHGVLFSVVAISGTASGNAAHEADGVVNSFFVIVAAAHVQVVNGRALDRGCRVIETVPYAFDLVSSYLFISRYRGHRKLGKHTQMGEGAVHSCGRGVALRCGVKFTSGGANGSLRGYKVGRSLFRVRRGL